MPKKVLVIEDSATEALRARLILEREGFQVSIANESGQGLDRAGAELPDAILLDAYMPNIDGYEVWEKLRSHTKTANIPVVMVTTAEVLPTVRLGRDGFLTKPYDPKLLATRINEVIASSGEADAAHILREKTEYLAAELRQAKAEADSARQVRSEFLAVMSHELRTPLHEFMGMTDLVLSTDLTEEQHTYLETAKVSAHALLTIVSEMLEYSEAEAGEIPLESKDLNLQSVVREVVDMMTSRAQEKGLELSARLNPDAPKELVGDARRLRQVLVNLVGNGIKFTDAGQVSLVVELSESQDQEAELHFLIRDTGIGIAKDKQKLIFEAFRQGDGSTTRRYGGVGLGLAMSQKLVRAMGGRIWVESDLGQGSIFHFTARLRCQKPLPASAIKPAQAATPGNGLHLRILLAEDSPTNQLIAVANLKKAGHSVTVANNGRKAVEAWGGNGSFDLVLMDVAMPEMDGLEATRTIREREKGTSKHIPIIAMTAFAMKEYQEKCRNAGMDGYVSKPVSPYELHRTIEPILAAHRTAPPAPREPAEPPVNLTEAMEVVGGDPDLLRDVVDMSLQECPEQVEALRGALAQGDPKGVERPAHRLKGVMGNVGAFRARAICQRLETMGEVENLAGGPEAFHELQEEFARVAAFFSQPGWEKMAVAVQGGA